MNLVVEKVENGAIIEFPGFDDVGEEIRRKMAFQFNENNLKSLAEMLWEIVRWLGLTSRDYARETISIRIVHGSGYTCKDKECNICKEEE